jgi:hypothetical protein
MVCFAGGIDLLNVMGVDRVGLRGDAFLILRRDGWIW